MHTQVLHTNIIIRRPLIVSVFWKTNQSVILDLHIPLIAPTKVPFMRYQCTVPLPSLANWSAF